MNPSKVNKSKSKETYSWEPPRYIICSGVILVNKKAKFCGMGSGLLAVGKSRLVFKLLLARTITNRQKIRCPDFCYRNKSTLNYKRELRRTPQSCSRCSSPP